ncbi:MAG TPA: hypothetical protein VEL72_00935 [Ktedonobacteraceae bacterium]|nr:hypothetical protein [Ktedonobacteraceae bacterium]
MFDPRDPRERLWWHYDSRRPLSMAQIIAVRSVDAQTAALIWLLLEHGASLTIAGPTDPQPGIGKTTTLNALLQFVPEDSALAYMSGMYEDFAFMQLPDIEPDHTYALCNEVSDHLPIYMWGRVARRYLTLPARGYHIATSVHADTIDDVLYMYQHDLRLPAEDVRRLGLVVNIGVVGHVYPLRRRWLTTHFLQAHADAKQADTVVPLPLSLWNEFDDTFEHADQPILDELAQWACMTPAAFAKALKLRTECLEELSQSGGVGMHQMYDAINDLRKREKKGRP